MMLILVKTYDVRYGGSAKAHHGRLRPAQKAKGEKCSSHSHFGFVFEKSQIVISTPSFSNSPFFKMFFSRKKTGSRDGAVARALASHRCGPAGSIPGPGVTCGLSLLLVLVPAPRVFLRVLRFSSLHKNQHF